MRKKQISIVLLLVMALVMASPMIGYVQASPTTIIEILPETTVVGIEENFMVSINILDAIDLYGFQFVLRYDPNVLNAVAVDVVEGFANIDREFTGDPVWDGYNCDVLEDGVLDIYDYFAFAAAYNTVEGDLRYNPRADFDSDGDVDMYDFSIFAQAWARFVDMPGTIQFERLDAYVAWEGGIFANVTFKAISFGETVLGLDSVKLSTDMGEPIPYEIRNGTVLVTIAGDIDGDFDVDMFDFGEFAQAYASSEGEPRYNVRCDFDRDGDVDMFDFNILAGNYAKSV